MQLPRWAFIYLLNPEFAPVLRRAVKQDAEFARNIQDHAVIQCFLNYGSRPKSGSPRLCGWIAKARKLSCVNEKDLCEEDLRSEEPS